MMHSSESQYVDPDDEIPVLPSEVDHVSTSSAESSMSYKKREYIAVLILFFINLLNYMDRFTIAGVLDDVKIFYQLDDSEVGLLQTSFIVSYMLLSPLFGYFGDRWNRKYLIIGGVSFWSLTTLASSFVPKENFIIFLIMRALVGVGEASYSTVAPTILGDIFVGDIRSKVLSFFYFAVPVGSGLGYIIGAILTKLTGHWQWALRATPILGVVCLILLAILVREPPRGRAEGGTHLHPTSWFTDIKQLMRNPSFMFVTLGFTSVSFVAGALTWWVVIYINTGIDNRFNDSTASSRYPVGTLFGLVTCLSGLLGVLIGSEIARRWRSKTIKSDPLVCGFGMIMCAPFFLAALIAARTSFYGTFVLIFIGETFMCLNWALVTDMTLAVVIPTRRSTASAFQMVISHTLGDAGSPYLIGIIADKIADNRLPGMATTFISRQYALYTTPFAAVLGGGFFLAASLFIGKGKYKVNQIVKESQEHYRSMGRSYEPNDDSQSVAEIT